MLSSPCVQPKRHGADLCMRWWVVQPLHWVRKVAAQIFGDTALEIPFSTLTALATRWPGRVDICHLSRTLRRCVNIWLERGTRKRIEHLFCHSVFGVSSSPLFNSTCSMVFPLLCATAASSLCASKRFFKKERPHQSTQVALRAN